MNDSIIRGFVLFLLSLLPAVASTDLFQHDASNDVVSHFIDYQSELPSPYPLTQLSSHHQHRSLSATDNDNERPKPYFTLRSIDRPLGKTSPADVHIKIFNHSPEYWYSITVVSPGVYTGTANFLRMVLDRPGTPLLYSWIPPLSGDFEVIVHELKRRMTGSAHFPIVKGQKGDEGRVKVVDKEGHNSQLQIVREIAHMPPCQTVQNRRDLYTVWDGSWLGANLHGQAPGMRTGWYFHPSSSLNCKIEYFTDRELRLNPTDKSIYILGSSKERGVFSSLVDMLLDTSEKQGTKHSVIGKCWGRAFIVKNKLKVFYQDWRSNYFQKPGSSADYLCHNEKLVREGGMAYTDNGHRVWDEIFEDTSAWPSVILMSVGNDEGFAGGYDLDRFIRTMPESWPGTLLLTDGAFSAMRAGQGDEEDYIEYRKRIRELVLSLNDDRVKWMDGKGLSKEQRMYTEGGPDTPTASQHFHSVCESSYIDEGGKSQDMKICSNVTEMIGQLLIGYALGPKDEYLQHIENSVYDNNKEVMYCHACPAELLPFHITHHPDMTCATGALHPRSQNEINSGGVPLTCPDACFDIPPVNVVQTQSGVVNERHCPPEFFQDLPQSDAAEVETEKNLNQLTTELDHLEKKLPHVQMNEERTQSQEKVISVDQTRMANIPQLEVHRENALLTQEEAESIVSSFIGHWLINMIVLIVLSFCWHTKIKSLVGDNMHGTDNPYSSRVSITVPQDTKMTKYAFGVGILIGMLCIINVPVHRDANQSLRSTAVAAPLAPYEASVQNSIGRRPVMATFFEPVEGGCCGMSEEGHRNLVKSWEGAWQARGWDTKVYNAADARQHPKFDLVFQKLRDIGMNEYDQRCFWRWLAAAHDGDPMGGWQSDYDTFPLTLTGKLGLDLMKEPGFKSWTLHVPSLLHGDQQSWNKMVDLMIDHIRPDLDTTYRISDMVIFMYLRDHYNLEDLGITKWEASVYPGFPYKPSDVKPTIDCDKARQFLAAHISHASSNADYNEKHTYPKLQHKGIVITDPNVKYEAENRAEAGAIMVEDFEKECT